MDSQTSIIELKGVGEKTQKLFQKLNIYNVGDLINHYPRDYETFEEPLLIGNAKSGEVCAIRAMVKGIPNLKKIRNLTILNVVIQDNSGEMNLTFFNMPYLKSVLKNGGFYIFRGVIQTKGVSKIMEQPKIFAQEDYQKLLSRIQPCYSLTKGLSNQMVQKVVKQALSFLIMEEYYPLDILKKHHLVSYQEAIENMHFPTNYKQLVDARRRLAFDEFFEFILLLRCNKELTQKIANEYQMFETADTIEFLNQIPFPLTKAQKKVWAEIRNDLNSPYCMNRLVQGDVGSGKTIVAVLSLLLTVSSGYQGAMMAPTEVLATQHFETITEYIEQYELPFRPVLLVGSMTAKEKREAYASIKDGDANLIIGTHAVIQKKVTFKNLALVVTDEQHRFGVKQRETFAQKGHNPHVLVMSATPIPRTLAIILYGDLQISVIDELPANRLPIKNCVVNTSFRPKAYDFIAKEVAEGRQAYVICPMVDEGEMEGLENVMEYTKKLQAALPPSVNISYLHGKMRPADKKRIMEEFSQCKIDVLVSTTVIEVGINVPNSTVMMVENAERFGLAQLHQLRGRVGRGSHQSYCIFINTKDRPETKERLEILNKSNDGFFIASEDMKLRGPGDLFGIRQSGEFAFRIGDIYTDASILQCASDAVDELLNADGELERPENQGLKKYIYLESTNSVDFRTI